MEASVRSGKSVCSISQFAFRRSSAETASAMGSRTVLLVRVYMVVVVVPFV